MGIHKVKSPFMCRTGQFTDGKRDLCIGIKMAVMGMKPYHLVMVGDTTYRVDCQKAIELVKNHKAYFKMGDIGIVPFLLCSEVVERQTV